MRSKKLEDCQEDESEDEVLQEVLRKWSRGLFHHVRGGGHTGKWNPIYM